MVFDTGGGDGELSMHLPNGWADLVVDTRDVPPRPQGLPALDGAGVDDLDAIPAPAAEERHRVEVADQPGPEHGDTVASGYEGPPAIVG